MAANEHLKSTSSPVYTGALVQRLVPAVEKKIHDIEIDEARVVALTRKMGGASPIEPRQKTFSWQEKWPYLFTTTVAEAMSAAETAADVADATFIIPQMVGIHKLSGEHFRVSSIASSTLTIVRETGTTAATTWANGDALIFLPPALQEGSDPIQRRARMTNMLSNYSQRFAEATGLSDEMAMSAQYGPDEESKLATDAMREFARGKERAFLFGEPYKVESSDQATWHTGGLRYFCSMYNVTDFGGVVTYDALVDGLQDVARYSRDFIMMGGSNVHAILSKFPLRTEIARTEMSSQRFGFDVNVIVFPGGTVSFILNRTFDDAGYGNEALLFDARDVHRKQFKAFNIERDIQTNGAQRKEWMLVEDEGIQFDRPIAGAWFKGMDQAA